jgi:hypothetical protein
VNDREKIESGVQWKGSDFRLGVGNERTAVRRTGGAGVEGSEHDCDEFQASMHQLYVLQHQTTGLIDPRRVVDNRRRAWHAVLGLQTFVTRKVGPDVRFP